MSQSQFADFIGVNRPTLSHVLAGRNNPSLDIMMSIHRKFPQINVLWLFDGVGSYESDTAPDYPSSTLPEEPYANRDAAGTEPLSRFYQGELFAENPIFTAESTGDAQKRKEMPLQPPKKVSYTPDTQSDYAQKNCHEKLSK